MSASQTAQPSFHLVDTFGAVPTCQPTAALPGTAEKMRVLAGRVARREAIHHPLDARRDDPEDGTRRPEGAPPPLPELPPMPARLTVCERAWWFEQVSLRLALRAAPARATLAVSESDEEESEP